MNDHKTQMKRPRAPSPAFSLTASLAGLLLLSSCAPQSGTSGSNGWLSGQHTGQQGAAAAPTYPPLTGYATRAPGMATTGPSTTAGYAPTAASMGTASIYGIPTRIPAGADGVAGFAVAHLGNRLTTTEGRSLYVFDRDPPGQSVCVGECARVWPPYLVEPGSVAGREYGIIQRSDGHQQWAVGGRALYVYAGDQAPKQALGEGLDGTWHTVPYPVPAGFGQQAASASIPPFPTSTQGLPIFQGSGSK